MTIDLTQFHEAFYAESGEAIGQMENALLRLGAGAPEPELINTIFRVAHSIKGGAATFGFAEISSFTHTLESLLDQLRSNRIQVTRVLSDLLLRSIDLMREMLRAQQAQQPIDQQRVADLQFDLELAALPARAAGAAVPAAAPVPAPAAPPAPSALAHHSRIYRISFKPLLHLLARGNDPLRLFRELRELGDLRVSADLSALPPFAEFDPENCYLSWQLELRSAAPRESVVEVFDWAEGDCDLTVEAVEAEAGVASAAAAQQANLAASPVVAPSAAAIAATAAVRQPEVVRGQDGHKVNEVGSIRVSVDKIDEIGDGVGERLRAGLAQLERNVRELQESVMRVRMVPISFVFSRFPRMVRDLSQRLNKQLELKMTGSETELDKTVLEKIGDPLVHLLRNSIDHGIELPEQRVAAGKDPSGIVHLHAYHRGSTIVVEVTDDGGGLQRDRIVAKARERGLIRPDQPAAEVNIYELIFMPGFSTLEQASDVSGRGVGMDVVKRNVEELGGSIEVSSVAGEGSRFTITLPLTLAIVDGQTVAVGDENYIVPLTAIVESLQMRTAAVSQVVGRGEVLTFRGEYLPVLRLQQHFDGRSDRRGDDRGGLIMVVEGEGRRVGLCVDELLGQQQVVVKTLETNYGHIEGIAGATILGDGSVALILDVAGLTRAVNLRSAAA